jgi:regulator of sirC expression with transglutaminase-like and TPR domain
MYLSTSIAPETVRSSGLRAVPAKTATQEILEKTQAKQQHCTPHLFESELDTIYIEREEAIDRLLPLKKRVEPIIECKRLSSGSSYYRFQVPEPLRWYF